MTVKEVYAIRLNRKDESLRQYLDKFDLKRQGTEMKKLLYLGVSTVQAQGNQGDFRYVVSFTKQDQEILNYLNQFDVASQEAHLKRLLKIGYMIEQAQTGFAQMQQTQESKIDEMMQLLKQLVSKDEISNLVPTHSSTSIDDIFDQDVFTASLKEGLSLFESDDW